MEHATAIKSTDVWGHGDIPSDIGRFEDIRWQNSGFSTGLKADVIAAMARLRAAAGPGDTLLLDINCHGGPDLFGRYFMWVPPPVPVFFTGWFVSPNEYLYIEELDVPSSKACTINVFAGTCHSGHWVNYAKANLDLGGRTVTVFAVCGPNESSYGNLNAGLGAQPSNIWRLSVSYQSPTSGQSGLISAFPLAQTGTQIYLNTQVRPGRPGLMSSVPELWTRTPTADEVCPGGSQTITVK